jgi:hypothetical protein
MPALDLSVSLWFSGTDMGIHQYTYGGLEDSTDGSKIHGGAWFNLTDTSVDVTRWHDDEYVEQVRVIVSQTEKPDFDSYVANGGWTDLVRGDPVTFTHDLSWPMWLLAVRAECKSDGIGIHHQNAGGVHYGFGLWWNGAFARYEFMRLNMRNLTSDSVQVERELHDGACPQARVRVWKRGARVFLPIALSSQ